MELIREPKPGDVIDARMTMYPSRLRVVDGELALDDPSTTYYGYVVRGQARVHTKLFDAAAHPGTFFCIPGPGELQVEGTTVVFERMGEPWHLPLTSGSVFLLSPHEMHAFRTTAGRSSMDVIAYHPDSDWGPTDGVYPMLNRTYRQ